MKLARIRLLFKLAIVVLVTSSTVRADFACLNFYGAKSEFLGKLTTFLGDQVELEKMISDDLTAENLLIKLMRESKVLKSKYTAQKLSYSEEFRRDTIRFCNLNIKFFKGLGAKADLTQNELWKLYEIFQKVSNRKYSYEDKEMEAAIRALEDAEKEIGFFDKKVQQGLTLTPPKGVQIKEPLSDSEINKSSELELIYVALSLQFGLAKSSDYSFELTRRTFGGWSRRNTVKFAYDTLIEANQFLRNFVEERNLQRVDTDRIVRMMDRYSRLLNSPSFGEFVQMNQKSLFPNAKQMGLQMPDLIEHFQTYSDLIKGTTRTASLSVAVVGVATDKPFAGAKVLHGSLLGSLKAGKLHGYGVPVENLAHEFLKHTKNLDDSLAINNQEELVYWQKAFQLLESATKDVPKLKILARLSAYSVKEVEAANKIREEIARIRSFTSGI